MTIELHVQKKDTNVKKVRGEGRIPGVVYGPKQEPVSVSIEKLAFEKTLNEAGESTIVNLKGLEKEIEVLIHDVSFNPAKGGAEHVDFYAIEQGKELTANVALEFIGEAPVEKLGATVNKALHEIEVRCMPKNLPSHIDVDVTALTDEDSHILVSDLKIPEGVNIDLEGDVVVASVAKAREEEPEEVVETVDMESVEVEQKGKEEESTEENTTE